VASWKASRASGFLRGHAFAVEADARLDEYLSASELADVCRSHGIPIPGVADDALEQKAILRIGCLMAKVFGAGDALNAEGYCIERQEIGFYDAEHHTERKMKKYSFRR
jgi:hypothetical protein